MHRRVLARADDIEKGAQQSIGLSKALTVEV
jgi:hypothetical protein